VNWSRGHAFIATGSPFADVPHDDVGIPVEQYNNAFIFREWAWVCSHLARGQ
jgi:malic enzyme